MSLSTPTSSSQEWLQHELARFDPGVGPTAALTPPWTWYVDERFLARERERVFHASWQPVARADQVRNPGDCYAGTFLGKPFVIVRADDGKLRAFYNVCAHHAAEVGGTASGCQQLVCPYHGWTYDLTGRLIKAPGLGRQDNFETADYGLRPIAVAEWGPLVFVSFAEEPSDLRQDLAPLKHQLDELGFDDLRFVMRREYTIQCNWKVFVDNYLDGGYHVAAVHPGLAGQLNLDGYRTDVFERFSIQSCSAGGQGAAGTNGNSGGSDFAERIGGGSLYAWLYPNLMINRYGPMMDTNWVVPISANETLTVFDYYFQAEYATGGKSPDRGDFIPRSLAASHQVQEEDIRVCESVHRGLTAGVFGGGRYASMEVGEFHFHKLLWQDLQAE